MTDTTVSVGDRAPQELKNPTKTRVDENFPVASRLIPQRVRKHVHVFYLCARAADDVADDPDLDPAEKTALMAEMDEALAGERGRTPTTETCHDLIEILDGTGVTIDHARHLLQAFRMDVTKPLPEKDMPPTCPMPCLSIAWPMVVISIATNARVIGAIACPRHP